MLGGLRLSALFLAFAFLAINVAMAQVTTGSISGTTIDQSGAAIPGVAVTATNVGTGGVSRTTSDSSGLFRLSLLSVGTYNLEFAKQGFASAKIASIAVTSGVDRGLGGVKLKVGAASTTVEVTAAAPLVQTTQAQVSSTFSGQTLQNFAGISEAEGLDNLAVTLPGVSSARDVSFSNNNSSNGMDFSANGIRSRNNDQQIDGENNNDNSVAGPSLFVVNPDFVQEYDITTNNFSAEYGRNSGSAVDEVTKSGTNVWHGDVMGSENNSFLNALSNQQKAPQAIGGQALTKLPRLNDEFTGGTIGGPIWKNHVFVFGGFDDQLISQFSVDTNGLTPTPTGLAQLASCYPNSPSVQDLQKFGAFGIGAGNPTPFAVETDELAGAPNPNFTDPTNGPVCQVEMGTVTRSIGVPFHEWDWIYRNDVVISDRDRFSGRYIFQKQHSFGNSAGGYPADVPALTQDFLLTETHTFSDRMVNEWRGSFSRSNVEFGGNQLGNTVPVQGQLTSALANVGISGLLGYGPANNFPQGRIVNTYQLQDNWNFYQGKSQWKAGVNFTYQRSPNIFLPFINGGYSFSQFTNAGGAFTSAGGCSIAAGEELAIAGQPSRAAALSAYACDIPKTINIALGNPSLDFREYDTFLYVGNDYKLKDNLTLNLGLTWSYYGQPANLFHTLTTKQQTGSTPFWNPSLPLSVTTAPDIPATHDLFGPGVGFAYTPKWGGMADGRRSR
jgi:carboxypeptidase family protein